MAPGNVAINNYKHAVLLITIAYSVITHVFVLNSSKQCYVRVHIRYRGTRMSIYWCVFVCACACTCVCACVCASVCAPACA